MLLPEWSLIPLAGVVSIGCTSVLSKKLDLQPKQIVSTLFLSFMLSAVPLLVSYQVIYVIGSRDKIAASEWRALFGSVNFLVRQGIVPATCLSVTLDRACVVNNTDNPNVRVDYLQYGGITDYRKKLSDAIKPRSALVCESRIDFLGPDVDIPSSVSESTSVVVIKGSLKWY